MLRPIIALLGLIVLIIFAFTINFGEMSTALVQMNPGWLLAALGTTAANIALKALRWRHMVQSAAHVELSFLSSVGAVMAGVAGASLLPGRAFEVTKPMMLHSSHGVPMRTTVPYVLFERILDLAALCGVFLISAVSIIGQMRLVNRTLNATAAFGLIALIVLIARPEWMLTVFKKATRKLQHTKIVAGVTSAVEDFIVVRRQHGAAPSWTFLTAAAMLFEVLRAYFVFAAFDLSPSLGAVGFAFSGSILLGLLSLIPGGLGITETSLFAFLSALLPGGGDSALRGAVLADRFISYYLLVACGAIVLLLAHRGGSAVTGQRSDSHSEVR